MTPFLNIALKAARSSGNVILRFANKLHSIKIESKSKNDFVSEADKESELIIVNTILDSYPNHKIKSEESGCHGNDDSEYEWIIDPLDGTTNYLHGHTKYSISIALKFNNVLTDALVFAPELNELYMASRGKGAYLNDKRIRVSKRFLLNESLIATGFPVTNYNIIDKYLSILKDFFMNTAGVRRNGVASLDLCDLATGKYEGYFEFNLKPWDIAAGALIVQEAGGLITDENGDNNWLETGNIIAGNHKILSQMLNIIYKYK